MLLPSLNIAYNYNKKTLIRLAYGKTVNRPEFRELSPFSFYDFENNFIISGNPNLTFATVQNLDLRWERYPKANEVISAALFYKQFTNPIEQYFVPCVGSGGTRSFMPGNALSATSYGAELDFRKSLSNISKNNIVKNITVVANPLYLGDFKFNDQLAIEDDLSVALDGAVLILSVRCLYGRGIS